MLTPQKWCAVRLTGENEDGNLELRVPFQASSLVQDVMNELAGAVGRTLPPGYGPEHSNTATTTE